MRLKFFYPKKFYSSLAEKRPSIGQKVVSNFLASDYQFLFKIIFVDYCVLCWPSQYLSIATLKIRTSVLIIASQKGIATC
jgi:hypothetical protein